jgi:hypothetical protein
MREYILVRTSLDGFESIFDLKDVAVGTEDCQFD